MKPIRALDGLRGLAALIVVLEHFTEMVPRFLHGGLKVSGHVGVMIFFALSGFLMGYLYLGRAPTRHRIAHFLIRRVARVVPLYAVVVLASFAVCAAAPGSPVWTYSIPDLRSLFAHLVMVRATSALWTVPVEIQFYLLVPFIWIAFDRAPRATLIGLFAAIAGLYAYWAALGWPAQGRVLVTGLPYFLAGLAIARCVTPGARGRRWDLLFLALLAGLPLLFPRIGPHFMVAIDWWLNPLCLAAISLLLVACLRSRLADAILGSRPFRFLGKVSYGTYLLHLVVIANLIHFTGLHHRAYVLLVLSLAAILAVAQLAWAFIERPARDAINGWFDRRAPRLARRGAA